MAGAGENELQPGYLELLQRNVPFRRLWYGQLCSQMGDWLDFIALSVLLLHLTGSATAVAGLIMAQFLPHAFVSPLAGVVVDRIPRKKVMIATDLSRAALVLLYFFVRDPSDIWLVYVVTVLKYSLNAFYEPAREALVPTVAEKHELVAANGISGMTWAIMLAGGAAIGGLVTNQWGASAAFSLDSFSFLLSAWFTARIKVENEVLEDKPTTTWQDLKEGIRYLAGHREARLYALSKSYWSVGGGGVLVLLTVFGKQIFPLGQDGALSIGLFYAARGTGAGIGPWLAYRWDNGTQSYLRTVMACSFFVMALGYLVFSFSPWFTLAMIGIIFGHMGGSVQWVFSASLLQMTVPAHLRGRVFAIEICLLTLAASLSSWITGMLIDIGVSAYLLSTILALIFIPFGLYLLLAFRSLPVKTTSA